MTVREEFEAWHKLHWPLVDSHRVVATGLYENKSVTAAYVAYLAGALAMRERAAKACELVPASWPYPVAIPHPALVVEECAAAIRALK